MVFKRMAREKVVFPEIYLKKEQITGQTKMAKPRGSKSPEHIA
jgi:hypothetical protein